ncbi:hypothetical protein C8D87_106532 [Lentzea atacamensis]|uniref:Uncharacterized protein n=1 Tax=Lentzea atacamensis TaxID=531938 RepID=A0ABX9E7H3_9PSEU|nr:hypothetical protein [Lentzea atacamensis]RAS64126.1 hypothetical protein C8D87_106532 [Lentzea atacamensis]
MLREAILFLEEFIRGHGPPAVAKAVVGLMSFAVLLGAVLGSTAIKSGALVAAILLAATAGIVLAANRGSERRELEAHKELVSRYCNHIDKVRAGYQIREWDETMVIGDRGDAQAKVTVRLRPLRADLLFIRLKFGCGWNQPARYRHRVRMSVRNLLVDGSAGTTLQKTLSWPKDGAMTAIIHFHSPPQEDSEISFAVELDWPKRCLPLMEGSPDEFALMFAQPVAHAIYKVVLPTDTDAYVEPIGQTPDGYRLDKCQDDMRRQTITLELFDPPVRHRAGARLELVKEQRAVSRR